MGEGEIIPFDGEVVSGLASVDESALTGESAPVVRSPEPGHHSVLAGSRVRSGRLWVRPSPFPPLERPAGPRVLPWWPGAALAWAAALVAVTGGWGGPPRALVLLLLCPPYLSLLARAPLAAAERALWRRLRVLPVQPDALWRAARCDTLLVLGGAVDRAGRLAAVQFHPLPGVGVSEVAAAAHQANARAEAGAARAVYILARQLGGAGDGPPVAEPLCGPVDAVARQVALRGGDWPAAAIPVQRVIAVRGAQCLAVADGGRPLGLVELRALPGGPTLEDARRGGLALAFAAGEDELPRVLAGLRQEGRRYAVAWGTGMPHGFPPDSAFVLTGTAWAASRPSALDLDGDVGKLPGLILGARRLWRRGRLLRALAAAADLWRAAAAALLAAGALGTAARVGLGRSTAGALLALGLAAAVLLVVVWLPRRGA